jgi:hypothetical protein
MNILEQIEARAAAVIDPVEEYVERYRARVLTAKKPLDNARLGEATCDKAATLARRGVGREPPLDSPEAALEWAKASILGAEAATLLTRLAQQYGEQARTAYKEYRRVLTSCLDELHQEAAEAAKPQQERVYRAQGNGGGKLLEQAKAELLQVKNDWRELVSAVQTRLERL